ncbi:hypothetical protein SAMN02799622_02021 [Methylobacterium sp. UNC378MF]|uniref:hypothetical protein n=1 Tax=Methylobacterium sp. UNC378MF TaxID=1502748 RepID=UPI00088DBB16|nr:hypothetical protein [Methylobacterium sp. UNC378MF]SDA18401.1 hypothetical protein SAMN02799622_02021 [Methylobacterium sp. UNC378MF]
MREMPVVLSDGQVDDCLPGIVQAHMLFPDDFDSIEEEIECFRLRSRTGFRKTNLGRHMAADFESAQLGGMYAGTILYNMMRYSEHRPDLKISWNKAVFIVSDEAERLGKPIGKNINTIKKYWLQYKNSAHIWMSYLLAFRQQGRKFPIDHCSMLTLSEQIVDRAALLVTDWDPWRAPVNFPFDGTELHLAAPDNEDVARIKRYRA